MKGLPDDNPWRSKAFLCEMYDKLYAINERAYHKMNRA